MAKTPVVVVADYNYYDDGLGYTETFQIKDGKIYGVILGVYDMTPKGLRGVIVI